MKGLTKAIANEKYCVDLMMQSLAIQQSLKSLNGLLLENHLRSHVKHQLHGKQENKAVTELVQLFTLSNRA